MALITTPSPYSFGLGDLDFSQLREGAYYTRAANVFSVRYDDGWIDTLYASPSDNFTYDGNGTPISGTVIELTFGEPSFSFDSIRISNINIPIASIIAASTTSSRDDDFGVMIEALRGDDFIYGNQYNDALEGFDGNDSLKGGKGDDLIIGGNGDDVAIFEGRINSYASGGNGDGLTVFGPDGTDQLFEIERIQFDNGTISLVDNDPLFDTVFYYQQNSDVFSSGVNALEHYKRFGAAEGRDPNEFFDSAAYLAVNPQAKAIGALEHYRTTGAAQGLDTSLDFDARLYLLDNPDVAKAGINPLEHFLLFGKAEGRMNYMVVGESIAADGFDDDFYLFANPDVVASGMNAREHYTRFGFKEGRDSSAYFDTDFYLQKNPDVAASGVDPLTHYDLFGYKEGRDPSSFFDTSYYLSTNPDVAAAQINPLTHYLTYGLYEGRSGTPADDLNV